MNLFDPELRVRRVRPNSAGAPPFLTADLKSRAGNSSARVLASACKAPFGKSSADQLTLTWKGVGGTPAIVLLHSAPRP